MIYIYMNIFICHEEYSRKANINIQDAITWKYRLKFARREIWSLKSISDIELIDGKWKCGSSWIYITYEIII